MINIMDIFRNLWWTRRSFSSLSNDAYNCKFQGRFIFENDKDIKRAKQMGIENLTKNMI